jgi:hypothetical protein
MSHPRIDAYIDEMSHHLAGLNRADALDVIEETRSHLHERAGRGELESALKALGRPKAYASRFTGEAVLGKAPRRAPASLGTGLVMGAMALVLAALAAAEFLLPAFGIWVNAQNGTFVIGTVNPPPAAATREIIDGWLGALALAGAAGAAALGVSVLRTPRPADQRIAG